jgi:hypothetical protein
MTIESVWWLTLAIYAVVLVVVAALLTLILREAKRIHAGVSEIWNVGQKVANNTIHIALLEETNHIAGQILSSAKGIIAATTQIGAHAASCPGCPNCALRGRR